MTLSGYNHYFDAYTFLRRNMCCVLRIHIKCGTVASHINAPAPLKVSLIHYTNLKPHDKTQHANVNHIHNKHCGAQMRITPQPCSKQSFRSEVKTIAQALLMYYYKRLNTRGDGKVICIQVFTFISDLSEFRASFASFRLLRDFCDGN